MGSALMMSFTRIEPPPVATCIAQRAVALSRVWVTHYAAPRSRSRLRSRLGERLHVLQNPMVDAVDERIGPGLPVHLGEDLDLVPGAAFRAVSRHPNQSRRSGGRLRTPAPLHHARVDAEHGGHSV